MNTSRALVVVASSLVMSLAACTSEAIPPTESVTTAAQPLMAGGDCSSSLGTCYQGCQAQPPTPTVECFTGCDRTFYACISPAEMLEQ